MRNEWVDFKVTYLSPIPLSKHSSRLWLRGSVNGWGWEDVFPVVSVGHENNDGPALYSIDTHSLSLFIKSNTLFVIATGGPTHVYTTHETRPRGQWLDKNTVAPA